MIRKILVIFLILFSAIWFSIAYILKVKTASYLENFTTTNVELSYERISVTGFPWIWHVKIKQPKLKFTSNNNHKEVTTSEIDCTFDLSFKKAQLVVNDKIKQEQDFGQEKTYYYLSSSAPVIATVKFNKPFYKFKDDTGIVNSVKAINLESANLNGIFKDEKIFDINNLNLSLRKVSNGSICDTLVHIQGDYLGQNYLLGFNSASLKMDLIVSSVDKNIEALTHEIYKLNDFELIMDDDSKVGLSGSFEIQQNKVPQGQFFVSLVNYSKVIDKLVNPNFIVPKSTLKQIIVQEGKSEVSDSLVITNVNNKKLTTFEVNFSERGVVIGSVNLFDVDINNSETNNDDEH